MGHCSYHLEGISGAFVWSSCWSCLVGLFIWYLDGFPLADKFSLFVYCRLDIITWISLPFLYIISLLYQSYPIAVQLFVHHYQWPGRLIRWKQEYGDLDQAHLAG
jgi:hypothetical protein